MVLVWGRLSDRSSPRIVVTTANLLAGLALILFVQAKNVFPQLLLVSHSTQLVPSINNLLKCP